MCNISSLTPKIKHFFPQSKVYNHIEYSGIPNKKKKGIERIQIQIRVIWTD